ncbi:MAG TPA: hypothetical protein VLX12_02880 [Syntrophorhabdales bacterium]|nr:hypothetical protein [Syntrophorhabdales bacterium]
MPMLLLKPRPGPASRSDPAGIFCAAVIAMLFMVLCGMLHAEVELPVLNTTGPATFRGEIAKGLKIEMRLYRDGSSIRGTYSYEAFGRDIQVRGTINEHGEVSLHEFVKSKVTGRFAGRFVSNDRIEGKWYKKSNGKGRSFYLVGTGSFLGATAAPKSGKIDRETSPATKGIRSVPRAEATVRPAPMAVEARPEPLPSVRQQSASVAREVPVARPENEAEAKAQPIERPIAARESPLKMEPTQPTPAEQNDLRAVVAEESPKVAANIEARPVEKSRVEGTTNDLVKKKGLPWASLLSIFNVKVAGGVGGILLLGSGLAWLAVVAGGAAAFRENSALFRQAHAMGISFLPGIFLLALGVGAVLAVFVE